MLLSKISEHSCIIILYTVEKNIFCYCLQVFSTEEILKCHVKNSFKINSKEKTIMPKKTNLTKNL